MAQAHRWIQSGLARIPSFESARGFFAPYVGRIHTNGDVPEAFLAAIKALLDAEQY